MGTRVHTNAHSIPTPVCAFLTPSSLGMPLANCLPLALYPFRQRTILGHGRLRAAREFQGCFPTPLAPTPTPTPTPARPVSTPTPAPPRLPIRSRGGNNLIIITRIVVPLRLPWGRKELVGRHGRARGATSWRRRRRRSDTVVAIAVAIAVVRILSRSRDSAIGRLRLRSSRIVRRRRHVERPHEQVPVEQREIGTIAKPNRCARTWSEERWRGVMSSHEARKSRASWGGRDRRSFVPQQQREREHERERESASERASVAAARARQRKGFDPRARRAVRVARRARHAARGERCEARGARTQRKQKHTNSRKKQGRALFNKWTRWDLPARVPCACRCELARDPIPQPAADVADLVRDRLPQPGGGLCDSQISCRRTYSI